MSEFMGLIRGTYEAKQEGFLPGGEIAVTCICRACYVKMPLKPCLLACPLGECYPVQRCDSIATVCTKSEA